MVTFLLVACSNSNGQVASHSASPESTRPTPSPALASPSPSPSPSSPAHLASAYGVLTDWQPSAGSYNVYLVTPDGAIAAKAQSSTPRIPTCGPNNATPYLPPPVSTSSSLAYFMDAQGQVRSLSPDGKVGDVWFSVAVGSGPYANGTVINRWSFFSVSPDGYYIAVTTVEYDGNGGAHTMLLVDNILTKGAIRIDAPSELRFQETGSTTLWPIGWHSARPVLAVVPVCSGAIVPTYWATELHVVDPITAERYWTIGGPDCLITGPPAPGGVLCETHGIDFVIAGWDGARLVQEPSGLSAQQAAYLSPNGKLIAVPDPSGTRFPYQSTKPLPMITCGWIDDSHVLGKAGVGPTQATVGNVSDGTITTLTVAGSCAGRIPGSL